MSQRDYNEHYDATAAKGLCWECETNTVDESDVLVEGELIHVASLWCLPCKGVLGFEMVQESQLVA